MPFIPQVSHWGKIVFQSEGIRTDLLLYRERSALLIPDLHEENRFVAVSREGSTSFFIGSSSEGQFALLKSFFQRVYDCTVEPDPGPKPTLRCRIYTNVHRNRKFIDFYYPQFVRSAVNVPNMIPGIEASYTVIIRSGKSITRKRKFSFAIVTGSVSGEEEKLSLLNTLDQEVTRMRERFRYKLRVHRRNSKLRSVLFDDPFVLCSFVRIPEDEGNP